MRNVVAAWSLIPVVEAAWVTITLWSPTPEAVMVIIAVRIACVVFWVYVAVMVPFPVPEGVQVHKVISELAFQLVFDVTVKMVFPAAEDTFWFAGATASVLFGLVAVNEPTIPIEACGVQT